MSQKLENEPKSKITADDIRRGMKTIAKVIKHHGDDYWPIMERLQRELAALEGREKLLNDLLRDD